MRIKPNDIFASSVLPCLMAISILLAMPGAARARDVGHWEPRASMPQAVDEPRGVTLDGKIYIFGGLDETGFGPLGVVMVYDLTTDEWMARKDMPVPGHHLMLAEHNGKIYVFGGFDLADDIVAWRALDNSWEYTPETDSWKALPALPAGPRAAGEATVVDGKIYVIGGAGPAPGVSDPIMVFGGTHAVVGTVEVYDPETNGWTTKRSMPTPRNHFHASAVGGKIYAFGGRMGSAYIPYSSNTDVVEAYDPASDNWSIRKPMPTARSGVGGTAYNGKIYVAGGEFQSDKMMAAFRVFEVYDPATNTWSSDLPRMPVPRHGFVGILVGNMFHVLGGGFQSAGVGRVNVITDTHDVFIFNE